MLMTFVMFHRAVHDMGMHFWHAIGDTYSNICYITGASYPKALGHNDGMQF